MKITMVLLAAVLLGGCAGDKAAGRTGPGFLDADWVHHVSVRQGAWRAKVFVDADGSVNKLELYHHDTDAVPAPVKALTEQTFPGAKLEGYELELYAGEGWVHEIEVTTSDGKFCEVSATDAGVLRYTECRFPVAELDPAIAAKVAELVPGGKLEEAEKRDAAGTVEIRVESVVENGVVHYLRFQPTGELITHRIRMPAMVEVPAP